MEEERKHQIIVKREIDLTDEDVTDIVVTALEGGVGYWACLDNTGKEFENAPSDEPTAATCAKILLGGGELLFIDTELVDEEDAEKWNLSLEMLLEGIRLYIEKGKDDYYAFDGTEPNL